MGRSASSSTGRSNAAAQAAPPADPRPHGRGPRASGRRAWLGVLYGFLALGAAAMLVAGLITAEAAWSLAGLVGFIVVAATAPVAIQLVGLSRGADGSAAAAGDRIAELLAQIREHSMLSDNAKRVLFRDRELQMLRSAIEGDIARGDHDAAVTLCDEMANLFGHREEAEAFRSRIAQVRQEHYEAQLGLERERFETHLEERNWAAVHQQAARIRRLYPDSHLVDELDQRILQARDEHKRELEAAFLEAAQREDVETAMSLLKQLDLYLDREEANRLREVAQGVIVRHRQNLGAAFRLAVNEHRWAVAAGMGETIVAEFPNSKMATEVRSMIDVLRTRAAQAAVAFERSE